MKMNLKQKILAIVIVPALLIGTAALIISNLMVTKTIENEIKQQLKIAANSGLEYYEYANDEKFTRDEDGTVKKGDSFIISNDFRYVDNMLEKSNVHTTFFYGDERIITSIKDKSGERLIGTKASDKVVDTVLNNGKEYYTKNVIINDEKFYGYYIPIAQPGTNEIVGMFFAGDTAKQVSDTIRNINIAIGSTILGILIISIFIATLLVLAITKILNRTVAQLDELSMGKLNFQENKKDLNRKDEIGEIVKATMKLKNSLINVIKNINETSGILHESSEKLEQVAEETVSTTEGIEKAVEDIAAGAMYQAESTENVSKQFMIMGESIENTTVAVGNLKTNSDVMKLTSEDAMKTVEALGNVNQKTQKAIDIIYTQTNETNEFALKIKAAANVITSIAEETNLLSLNASIEAARSGEAGRGFAVVADQIKKLAEQSSQSAKQIDDIIRTLIDNSNNAVTTMEEVKNVIGIQNENLEKTKETFHVVYKGIHESIASVNQISDITTQLNTIRKTVIDIVTNLSAISQENAASTEETSAATEELSTAMNEVGKEVSILNKLAEDLTKNIKVFEL